MELRGGGGSERIVLVCCPVSPGSFPLASLPRVYSNERMRD